MNSTCCVPGTVLNTSEQQAPNLGLSNRESLPEVTARRMSRSLVKEMVPVALHVEYSEPGNKIHAMTVEWVWYIPERWEGEVKRAWEKRVVRAIGRPQSPLCQALGEPSKKFGTHSDLYRSASEMISAEGLLLKLSILSRLILWKYNKSELLEKWNFKKTENNPIFKIRLNRHKITVKFFYKFLKCFVLNLFWLCFEYLCNRGVISFIMCTISTEF